jgi:flagellar hook-associated protein 2
MATSAVASSSAGTLDVPSLVSQLMTVERQPIDKLNTKVASFETKLSSFGTLKGMASSFQSSLQTLSTSLGQNSATASDTSILSATASSSATAGVYSLNVTTLAQTHKLAAAGQVSDTTAISAGASTVTFTVGTTSTDVTIAAGATLQDIRTAINAANVGVTATIINDGSGTPYRLALSSDASGTSNAINSITVQAGGDAAVNDLLAYNPTTNAPTPVIPMAQTVAALDASFTLNGIQITKSSNTVTDAIAGVTLNLSKAGTSDLTVTTDTAAISKAVAGVVDSYNALYSQLKSRSAYGSATTATPDLAGDGTVRMMMEQMRGILGTPASGGTLTMLSQVGISFQSNGSLKVDNTKLDSAMANDISDFKNLFSSSTGFVTRLSTWSDSVVQVGGLIDQRVSAINTSITGVNDQISKLENQMTAIQKRYTKLYSDLNLALSRMNSTSAYLAQQFSNTSGG